METTLSDVLPNARWVADGVQTEFTFNFEPLKSEYMKVYSNGELVESGYALGDGVVTFATAPTSGTVINIMRQVPLSYQEKYENLGILTLEILNHKLVEVTAQLQGLAEKLQRAATAPINSDIVGEELMQSIIDSAATIDTTLEQVETIADEVAQAGVEAASNIGKAEQEAIARINQIGAGNSNVSRIWATGEDDEVEEIAPGQGEHSSRVSADIAFTIANEEPDIPLDESTLKAAEFIRGPKGDTGSTFTPHLDSGILSWTNDGNLENPENFDFNVAYEAVAAEGKKQLDLITGKGEEISTAADTAIEETKAIGRIWATGEDDEVEEIAPGEEEHSSRGYADLSMALANSPEDVPVDESGLVALDLIRGPQGEQGPQGEPGINGTGVPAPTEADKYNSVTNDGTSAFWKRADNSWFQLLTPYEDFYYMNSGMDMWYPGKDSPSGPKILSEIKYKQYSKYKNDNSSLNRIDDIVTLPANTTGEWKLPSVFEDLAPSSNEYSSFILCYGEDIDDNTSTTGYYAIPLTLLYKHIDKFWGADTSSDNTIVVDNYNKNLILFRKVGSVYKRIYVKVIIALQSNNFGDTVASINPKDGNYFNWLNTAFPTLFNTLKYYTQNFVLPKAAWAAMPSSKYIDLSLGESGSIYTAPDNGYFYLSKQTTQSQQYIYIDNITAGNLRQSLQAVQQTGDLAIYCPVSKGDKVLITYNAGGVTNNFRFVYANGSAN